MCCIYGGVCSGSEMLMCGYSHGRAGGGGGGGGDGGHGLRSRCGVKATP